MGYRSEWKLVFNTAGRAKEVKQWFENEAKGGTPIANLMQEMLDHALQHEDDNVLEFGDDGWKLYDWDGVISTCWEKWGDNEEVDYAYARLGEDYDDNDIQCGEFTYIGISRVLTDSDCYTVPKVEQEEMGEVKQLPALKCTCGGFGSHSSWCDLETGEYTKDAYDYEW